LITQTKEYKVKTMQSIIENSVLNANNYNVPNHFLRKISQLRTETIANPQISWKTISSFLQTAVADEWNDLQSLGNNIVNILESEQKFVVIKNLPFRNYPRPLIDYLFASLSLCLGNITVHNSSNNPIWDVTLRDTGGREPTFSELNVEAPLHTDSAFRLVPEKYFGLWAIQTARRGGKSTAIEIERVIEFLKASALGRQCLDLLSSRKFPFCVPPAFATTQQGVEIIQAPILGDSPSIRFRIDTLMAGFKHHPELATPERLWAVKYFEGALNNCPDRLEFKLNDGDVVFFNNHTMLHGRTAFSDRKRLLLRIRID
jgi:hypothetical protein